MAVEEAADWRAALPAVEDGVRLPTLPPVAVEPEEETLLFGAPEPDLMVGAPEPLRAADPNIVEISSGNGFSALHVAAVNGRAGIVASLLRAGARVELRTTSTGESAWDLAVAAGASEAADVLEAAVAGDPAVTEPEAEAAEPEPQVEGEVDPEPEPELRGATKRFVFSGPSPMQIQMQQQAMQQQIKMQQQMQMQMQQQQQQQQQQMFAAQQQGQQ